VRRLLPDPTDEVDLRTSYAVPPGRHVRVNFAASVDGAVSVDGRSAGLSSPSDRTLFHLLRAMSDVVLVGAGTARAENYGGAREGDQGSPPIAVVTRSLDLDPAARLFTDTQVRPIVLTCAAAPVDRRRAVEAVADVVSAGEEDVDLAQALDALAERGLDRVICEGGPHLFGSLAAAGLYDELCLTVAPLVVGGMAGRIVAGMLGQVTEPLHLAHVLEDDGHLFLRYTAPTPPHPPR
jgi:riboflavin-specific deaminase-like protein